MNLIQKDGKYYQIGYPVLLATSITKPNNHVDGEENVYILSDEEIKEGESGWFLINSRDGITKNQLEHVKEVRIDPIHGKVLVISFFGFFYADEGKKIIATTDNSLNEKSEPVFKGMSGIHEIWKNEITQIGIPSPSNDFLQVYVEAQGKMEKVLVEMIETQKLKIKGNLDQFNEYDYSYNLKLSPDNTITIKPFQEKQRLFKKEDIISFAKFVRPNTFENAYEKEFSQWFDENY